MWVFEMTKTGFSDRSKAIQTALHSFIVQYEWQKNDVQNGVGTINLLYDNHIFDQDTLSTQIQHKYSGIISASTHIYLDADNCLETIILKGEIKKMKKLAKSLSKNYGIKSIRVNLVSLV